VNKKRKPGVSTRFSSFFHLFSARAAALTFQLYGAKKPGAEAGF